MLADVSVESELMYIIDSIVLRYTMMKPAPFPNWYKERLEKVIDGLQVEISDTPDHMSLRIAGFIQLPDSEYIPEYRQQTQESAIADAHGYAETLEEPYHKHIRKMIPNTYYDLYYDAIKSALCDSDDVRKIKFER